MDNVDKSEDRADNLSSRNGDFVFRNEDSMTRNPYPWHRARDSSTTNGDSPSRNRGGENDRILYGFQSPEWHLESMGAFQDRPWYMRPSGEFNGECFTTSS